MRTGGHFRNLPTDADTYSLAIYDTTDGTCGTITTDLAVSFTTTADRSCGGFKRSELAADFSLDAATAGTSLIGSDVGLAGVNNGLVACCTIALKEEEEDEEEAGRRLQDDGSETDWEALYADGFEGGLGSSGPMEGDMDYDMHDDMMDYDKDDYDHDMMDYDKDYDDHDKHHRDDMYHDDDMKDGWDMMWGDGASSLVATGVIAVTAALAF